MNKLSTLLIAILVSMNCYSQSLNLGFLFKSGITVGGEYTGPAAFQNPDTANFQINKYRIQATIPLKTKLGVDLKNLDLKASQTFLTFNTSIRQPTFENINFENQSIYTFSTGITSLSAGIRNGIWLYSGNVYMSESAQTIGNKPNINALGYVARIRIPKLRFIYFYGAAAVYNFGKFIPAPIAGFRAKLNNKFTFTLVLPVQAKLSYKIKKGHNLEFGSTLSGFNSVYRDINDVFMNYRQLKNHVVFNSSISSQMKLSIEAGLSSWRNISFRDLDDNVTDFNITATPYGSISLNYTFGKSLFDMKLEGVD